MNDRELVSRQLSLLAILDDAYRATTTGALIAGICFAALGFTCPGMGLLGSILERFVDAAFVHRMANIPIWVMALMVVCGAFMGSVGILVWLRDRRAGSPTLAHLRASPEDPVVASRCQVVVRSGNRTAHFVLTTKSGQSFEEVANASYEPKVAAAIDAAVPRR